MNSLSKKAARTVSMALNRFYKPSAILVPKSVDDYLRPDALARELRLTNNRIVMMSDAGLELLRAMAKVIYESGEFQQLAMYSDIYGACKRVIEELMSEDQRPQDAAELVHLTGEKLAEEIDHRTFAVPMYGVKLVGLDSIELGHMKVVRAGFPWLESVGVKYFADATKEIETEPYHFWLIGSAQGTATVALQRFRTQAELAVGMLAISAASIHQRGATRIRIGVVMSPETAYGWAGWLSWPHRSMELTRHYKFRDSQDFKIDRSLFQQFIDAGVFVKAFDVLQSQKRSPLGEAIAKAVYWYSDAHREVVLVMKLVKFWSCVETFFSADKKDIVQSVSVGLTSVLVFGGFDFVPEIDYRQTKKRVAELYEQRSTALHGGDHGHVTERDTAVLSQWVAWMLISMVSFVDRGYTKVEQIKEIGEGIDRRVAAEPG